MNKQKITITLTTLAFLTTALFVTPLVFAQTPNTNTQPNFFQGLVQFFQQKFGLDKTQVETAVTDYKNQVRATITPRPTQTPQQIQDREKARLDKLVSSGKITSAQEQAILDELASLRSKYNLGGQNLTPDQRKTQMQNMRNELKTWANSQNINLNYVMPEFKGMDDGFRGFGKGGFGFRHFGPKPTLTPTKTN